VRSEASRKSQCLRQETEMKRHLIRERQAISKKRVLIISLIASLLAGCTVVQNTAADRQITDVFRGTADPNASSDRIHLPT